MFCSLLLLIKRFHPFACSQIVYEYLSVSIQWLWYALHTEDCSRYLQGHFWRECVHWDTTGFRVFTSFLVLSVFSSLNNHLHPFCLCIQFSSILHTIHWKKNDPVFLKETTWSCSFLLRHLFFSPLNEFHPIEVCMVLTVRRARCKMKLCWWLMEKAQSVQESWMNIICEQPPCWPHEWQSHPHSWNCRQDNWAGALWCSSCASEQGLV